MPTSQADYCTVTVTMLWMASLCSTLFILAMTFERFYSIIRPHKAASFNTVKRAKVIIMCSVIVSISYNIPHIFMTGSEGRRCPAYANAKNTNFGKFYYWFSAVINFVLPFILLLIMNCFIIHTIRLRPNLSTTGSDNKGQGQSEGQSVKIKSSEMQIFIILLLVTFGFLILVTPAYAFFFNINIANYMATPKTYAGYLLFHSVSQKMYFTNYGINFYLYVMSGQKFRTDLLKLFCFEKDKSDTRSLRGSKTSTSCVTTVA